MCTTNNYILKLFKCFGQTRHIVYFIFLCPTVLTNKIVVKYQGTKYHVMPNMWTKSDLYPVYILTIYQGRQKEPQKPWKPKTLCRCQRTEESMDRKKSFSPIGNRMYNPLSLICATTKM